MRIIGYRAYALNKHLKRADKLSSRALIGHLVGYDSTNIFRIWLPNKDEVIRVRDVVFDEERFYEGPEGYAEESIIKEVVELLAFPESHEDDDIAIDELMTRRQRRESVSELAKEMEHQQGYLQQQLITPELSI